MASLRARWSCTKDWQPYTNGAMRIRAPIVGVQLQSGDCRRQPGQPVRLFRCADHVLDAGRAQVRKAITKGGIVESTPEKAKDRDILVRIIVPKKNAKFNYQSV